MSFDQKGNRKRRNSDSSDESSSSIKGGKNKRKSKNKPNYGENPNMVPIGMLKFLLSLFFSIWEHQ